MENEVCCNICHNEFNKDSVIPKLLDCGHSFCLSCIEEPTKSNPICPKCWKELDVNKAADGYPTNYSLLKALYLNKTKDLLKKLDDKKEELSNKILEILTDLDQVKLDLEKLQELTNSEDEIFEFDKAAVVLKSLENKYKKNITLSTFFSTNDSKYIKFSDYENSKKYLMEIYKKLVDEEIIYAVKRVEDEMRYGKVSYENNFILFHALSETELPEDSFLIWFDELKKCGPKRFFTFLKLTTDESGNITRFIINMVDTKLASQFIRLCTGECGPTYKGCPYEKDTNCKENVYQGLFQLNTEKLTKSSVIFPVDYRFYGREISLEKNCFYITCQIDGSFSVKEAMGTTSYGYAVGVVENPLYINPSLFQDDSFAKNIVDCGICFKLL